MSLPTSNLTDPEKFSQPLLICFERFIPYVPLLHPSSNHSTHFHIFDPLFSSIKHCYAKAFSWVCRFCLLSFPSYSFLSILFSWTAWSSARIWGHLCIFPFCILLNLFTNQKGKRKNNILLMPNIPYLIGSQIFPINNMEHKLVSYTTPKKIPL